MGYRVITQIILIATAVLIVFTYVKPTFVRVKQTEDQAYQYSDAVAKATQYNQVLGNLIQRESNFSASDIKAAETFLPAQVDRVAVIADIDAIATQANLTPSTISAVTKEDSGNAQDKTKATTTLTHSDFSVAVNGTYDELKQFLLLLAQNDYQLDVVKLSVGSYAATVSPTNMTPTTDYQLTLRAYALPH